MKREVFLGSTERLAPDHWFFHWTFPAEGYERVWQGTSLWVCPPEHLVFRPYFCGAIQSGFQGGLRRSCLKSLVFLHDFSGGEAGCAPRGVGGSLVKSAPAVFQVLAALARA
jgi:hypothetical protein